MAIAMETPITTNVIDEPVQQFFNYFTYKTSKISGTCVLFNQCNLLMDMGRIRRGSYINTIRVEMKFAGYAGLDLLFVNPSWTI